MFSMKKALIFLFLIAVVSCKKEGPRSFEKLEGVALGTTFHITMDDPAEKVKEIHIDSLIHAVNRSLSTYLPNSDISKINRGDTTILVDDLFQEVFDKTLLQTKLVKYPQSMWHVPNRLRIN